MTVGSNSSGFRGAMTPAGISRRLSDVAPEWPTSTAKMPLPRSARILSNCSLARPRPTTNEIPNSCSNVSRWCWKLRPAPPPRLRTTSPSSCAAATSSSHSAWNMAWVSTVGVGVGAGGGGVTPGARVGTGVAVGTDVAVGTGADVGVGRGVGVGSEPHAAARSARTATTGSSNWVNCRILTASPFCLIALLRTHPVADQPALGVRSIRRPPGISARRIRWPLGSSPRSPAPRGSTRRCSQEP